jgi:hypothetical protein
MDAPATSPTWMGRAGLDDLRAVLDFERRWMGRDPHGAKANEIREHFGVTPALYFAALDRWTDTEAALRYAPDVVASRLRVREQRRRLRFPEPVAAPTGPALADPQQLTLL